MCDSSNINDSLSSKRVLVVERDELIRTYLQEYLSGLKCEVDTVATLEEAEEIVSQNDFMVVLLDEQIPGSGRDSAVVSLMQIKRDLPVIVMSGYPTIESVKSALRSGVRDYVVKPFDPEELHAAVTRVATGQAACRRCRETAAS